MLKEVFDRNFENIVAIKKNRHYFTHPLFDLKIMYSYVIEVANFESELGLHAEA